ncbi:YOR378W-like protein [Myxozyma melibiosi]|uniref:YOR378W-like protein n=1 Tax=Myxozyma melibiosi TaxID=54550 RepID=A0ABR1EXN9_9ASCO
MDTTRHELELGDDLEQHMTDLRPASTTGKVIAEMSLFKEILFVGVVALAQLLTQACLAQALSPLHDIGDSFGVSKPGELSWFCASYSLTVGTFILPAGRLGDIFGSRKVFLLGYIWFTIWTLIAGFAVYSNVILFHFSRAFQGIGPALILPNGLALLGRAYKPGMRKNMAFSIFGAVAPTGFLLGATFAGIFTELVWWPWNFWVGGMVMILATIVSFYAIPTGLDKGALTSFRWEDLSRLDPAGITTGVLGLVLFNIAWNQGPNVGWNVPYTYVLLILGVLFFAIFIFIELRWSEYPILPIREFKRDIYFVFACMALGWSSFGIWVFYWWQISTQLRGHSILLTVAQQTPAGISGTIAAIGTGFLLSRIPAQYIILASMLAFCVGNIIFATLPVNQIYWAQTFVGIVIIPFGMDMSFPSGTIISSNSMRREHQGVAGSVINTVVNYAVSIGLGIAGTAEAQVNKDGVHLLEGYRSAFYVAIGLSGMGSIVALVYCIMIKLDGNTGYGGDESEEKQ